jgi:hypothetical protein
MPMTKGCFRTCWFQTVLKQGFLVNDRNADIAKEIINSMGSSRRYEEDDEYKVFKDVTKGSSTGNCGRGRNNASAAQKKAAIARRQPLGLFKRK